MPDLFDEKFERELSREAPLADRIRPRTFDEFVGQEHIIGKGKLLRKAIENDELFSMVFWGPPGSGKTTLARIIAKMTKSDFDPISAVSSGLADLRKIIKEAQERRKFKSKRTIVFVDEIHRWNKAQQDSFLPYVENGTIVLIGATTENPSFEVIAPLLSRVRVFVLERLNEQHIRKLLKVALLDKERGLGKYKIKLVPKAFDLIVDAANGDARTALNAMEIAVKVTKPDKQGVRHITLETAEDALQHKALLYDKKGEEHYNVISAFIKSMRGSDPDAALYWLARMLEAGEDPLFIARRMVIFASEDVGMADPHALLLAVATMQAVDMVGLPEGRINLAHCATYLATAPKDNASYMGFTAAEEDVKKTLNEPVPLHLRNRITDLMKDLKYGHGYQYAHNMPNKKPDHGHLPKKLEGRKYYKSK